jgi:2-amino-4-hydroxy-6-hydroxymethyldihydropteridine diphosphokinase
MSLVLALGSNIGDRENNLLTALSKLNEFFGQPISISQIYESAAIGKTDQPSFYNFCVEYTLPEITPRKALETCLAIEHSMGRVREEHWGPRNIDIDIIFFGDINVDEEGLHVPHPRYKERSFVARPLMELDFYKTLSNKVKIPDHFEIDATPIRKIKT